MKCNSPNYMRLDKDTLDFKYFVFKLHLNAKVLYTYLILINRVNVWLI